MMSPFELLRYMIEPFSDDPLFVIPLDPQWMLDYLNQKENPLVGGILL